MPDDRIPMTRADFEERKCKVHVRELSGPGVCVDEIEMLLDRLFEKRRTVHEAKRHTRVVSEMTTRDFQYLGVTINRGESGVRVHAREEPRRTHARAGADFEKFTARLRCRECAKE